MRRCLAVVKLTLLGGCGTVADRIGEALPPAYVTAEGNYLSYDIEFTETRIEQARKSAARECGQRRRVSVEVNNTCSLTRCWMNFQCMSSEDAALFNKPAPAAKPAPAVKPAPATPAPGAK